MRKALASFTSFAISLLLILFAPPLGAQENDAEWRTVVSGPPEVAIPALFTASLGMMSQLTSGGLDPYRQEDLEPLRLKYLYENHEDLIEEIAQGGGAHLEELARYMGCERRGAEFSRAMKRYYSILPKERSQVRGMLKYVNDRIRMDPALRDCDRNLTAMRTERIDFAVAHGEDLRSQIREGRGERLQDFALLMGCGGLEEAFAQVMKRGADSIAEKKGKDERLWAVRLVRRAFRARTQAPELRDCKLKGSLAGP